MKVNVVLSETQDECSLCNRVFYDRDKAEKYKREAEKETGCSLYIISVDLEDRLNEIDQVLKAVAEWFQQTLYDSDTKRNITTWLKSTSRRDILRIIIRE